MVRIIDTEGMIEWIQDKYSYEDFLLELFNILPEEKIEWLGEYLGFDHGFIGPEDETQE